MRPLSPLRYPGGKACLTAFLVDAIDLNDVRDCAYFEPYAGGGGAALGLLQTGAVKSIHLNDADRRIYAFWKSVLHEADEFADRIDSTTVNIEEWHRQRAICAKPNGHTHLDLGFAAFFMNRCNRSGVLTGAGPIGGYKQEGNWKLDVRFNKTELIRRVLEIGELREQISISCQDAIKFLKAKIPRGNDRKRVFVYLDPPYVKKGQRLYLNAYERSDHKGLARYLKSQKRLNWIMSYDESSLIRNLYKDTCKVRTLPILYSLQNKRSSHELIVAPQHVAIPRTSGKPHYSKKAS